MSIIDFVESLNDEIHHFDLSVKKNGLKKLSKYLSEMSFYTTNAATIECLVTFYVNLLTEHYDMLNAVLEGIMVLIDFSEFSNKHARLVVISIVQMDVSQLNVSVRTLIFDLLERLFLYYSTGLQSLSTDFIRDYMTAINGESEPQCVLRVMRINEVVAETLNIENIYEELFESISVYFPIEFKTNKSSGSLTRIQLVEANKRSMLASPLFGAQLFPVLMEKLSSEAKNARLDSLEILAEAIIKMKFEDVLNYYLTFIDMLYFEYKNRDPEIQKFVGNCLKAISLVFQQKSSDSQLLECCWHLFEKCQSAISNDHGVMDFLLIFIKNQPRVWSGFLAYFLPEIMKKSIKDNLEDLERLENITNSLLACENQRKYKGLMDNTISKTFFTKATLLYYQINEYSKASEDNEKISSLFKLLSAYSLFNITLPKEASELNFNTESDFVIQSQVSLVSKAINYVSIVGNEALEDTVTTIVPKMIDLHDTGNDVVNFIVHLTESDGIAQSHIAYIILRSLSEKYIEVVLHQVLKTIERAVIYESATSCLAVLIERFNGDYNARLSTVLTEIVVHLLDRNEDLSMTNVDNISRAIANLGFKAEEGSKVQLLESLLPIMRSEEFKESTIFWFCSVIGSLPIELISKSITSLELLHMLFGLNLINSEPQVKSIICQTFASVINKSVYNKELEDFALAYITAVKDDFLLLLHILKASVYAGRKMIISKIIEIITSTEFLLTPISQLLLNNIQILSKSNGTINHFCTEEKLFPTRSLFYEQQIFYLLAQKYQTLAVSESYDREVRDGAMSLYLKLVDGFSEEVIELSLNEIISTIVSCLHVLANTTNKVSLQVQVLKSLNNLKSKNNETDLTIYISDIVKIIESVSDNVSSLTVHERLTLVKSIIFFSLDLQKLSTNSMDSIKKVIRNMLKDKKRIVRMETAKATGLLL